MTAPRKAITETDPAKKPLRLPSADSGWINGQTIYAAGGFTR